MAKKKAAKKPVKKVAGARSTSSKVSRASEARTTTSSQVSSPRKTGGPASTSEQISDGRPTTPTTPLIVGTRAELSAALNERIGKGSVRTIADWFKRGCPNEPGRYNVDEIEQWVLENTDTDEDEGERGYWATFRTREQALLSQAERLKAEGALVETAIVNALVERLGKTLQTMLNQLPDWFLSQLPSQVQAKQRSTIREKTVSKLDELCRLVADMIEEWAAESEASAKGK